MTITKDRKLKLLKNIGCTKVIRVHQVQIAILSHRINSLTDTLRLIKRPSFKERFIQMIGQRRELIEIFEKRISKDIVL